MIFSLDSAHEDSACAVLSIYEEWFCTHLKPVTWRVHGIFVPQALRDKGFLKKMNESLMDDEGLEEYLAVDTFKVEEGTRGDYYLL